MFTLNAIQVRRHLLKHLFGIMSSKKQSNTWMLINKCLETNAKKMNLQVSRVLPVVMETTWISFSSKENQSS